MRGRGCRARELLLALMVMGLNGGLLERAARKCELDGLRGSVQSQLGTTHRLYKIVGSFTIDVLNKVDGFSSVKC